MAKKLIVKNKYTVIPNSIIQDNRISSKALGMFCYIQNKKDDWEFSAKNISKHKKEGLDLVRTALIELETYGYLERIKTQDEKGFWGVDYILNDKPRLTNPMQENPTLPNPESGIPENKVITKRSKPIKSKKDILVYDFLNLEKQKNGTTICKELKKSCNEFEEENKNLYPKDMFTEFLEFWSEEVKKGMPKWFVTKKENDGVWSLPRRLSTWFKNYKPKQSGFNSQPPITPLKDIPERVKMQRV